MCLAIPGKLVAIGAPDDVPLMGKVDFGGAVKNICLAYLPDAEVGQYVLVHVGFAISRVDEETARATLEMLAEIDALDEELSGAASPEPLP